MKITLTGKEESAKELMILQLQRQHLGLSLKEAKSNIDCLLAGTPVEIEVASTEVGLRFVQQVMEIGVHCTIEE